MKDKEQKLYEFILSITEDAELFEGKKTKTIGTYAHCYFDGLYKTQGPASMIIRGMIGEITQLMGASGYTRDEVVERLDKEITRKKESRAHDK